MAFEYQNFATLGVNLNRQKYGPLDISAVFNTQADLNYYLSKGTITEGVSDYWKDTVPYPYAGQIISTVIDGEVEIYVLIENTEGTFETASVGEVSTEDLEAVKEELLAAIAAATLRVDARTIENNNGVLGLANVDDLTFKQSVPQEDGTTKEEPVSSYNVVIKEENGKAVIDYVVPSATTVEGLDTRLSVVEGDLAEVKGTVEEIEDKFEALVDNDTTYTFEGVTPEFENITPYFTVTPKDGTAEKVYVDTYTTAELDERDEYLKGLITQALIFKGVVAEENFNKEAGTIKVGEEWVNAEAGWVIVVNEADGTGKEYVFDGAKWELLGDAGDLATKSELEAAIKGIVIPEPDGNTEYEFTEQTDNSNVYFEVKSNEEGAEKESIHLDAYTRQETEDKIAEAIGELVIPEPDGNDNTEYALSLGDDGLTVILKTTEGVDAGSATIDAYAKSEIDDKLAIIGEDDEISENFTIINAIRGLEQSLSETDEKVGTLEGKVEALEEANVQADWAQDDESAPDYIKNRTHYYYETVEDEIIPAEQVFTDVDLFENPEDYQVTVNGEVCDWTIRKEMPQRVWTATNGENTYTMTWATGSVVNGYTLVPADAAWEFRAKSVNTKKLDKVYLPTDVVYTDALTDAIAKVEAKIPTEVGEDNIIEIIKLNGTALEVGADKSVDIIIDLPGLATNDVAGLVKTSSEVNGVSLNDNG